MVNLTLRSIQVPRLVCYLEPRTSLTIRLEKNCLCGWIAYAVWCLSNKNRLESCCYYSKNVIILKRSNLLNFGNPLKAFARHQLLNNISGHSLRLPKANLFTVKKFFGYVGGMYSSVVIIIGFWNTGQSWLLPSSNAS